MHAAQLRALGVPLSASQGRPWTYRGPPRRGPLRGDELEEHRVALWPLRHRRCYSLWAPPLQPCCCCCCCCLAEDLVIEYVLLFVG